MDQLASTPLLLSLSICDFRGQAAFTPDLCPHPFGPFDQVADFNDFLADCRMPPRQQMEGQRRQAETVKTIRARLSDDAPVSFCHGDLQVSSTPYLPLKVLSPG